MTLLLSEIKILDLTLTETIVLKLLIGKIASCVIRIHKLLGTRSNLFITC